MARDIALLIQQGLTPEQGIDAGTQATRAFLGVEESDDLVTYNADPRESPSVLSSPSAVVLRGVRVS